MNKMTFAQVDALTRSELIELLTDLGENHSDVQRMTHATMVKVFWAHLGTANAQETAVKATKTSEPKAAKAPKGKPCACECGGMTHGGTWLPGHDAKHASKMSGGSKHAPKECACGCGEWTKGGTFRPGHDARYYSSLHKSAGIGLDVKQPHVTAPAFLPATLSPNQYALIGDRNFAQVA